MEMFVYALFVICIVLYLLRKEYLSRTASLREHGNKIPGPKPLPFIGNALEFGISSKSLFNYAISTIKKYGPIFRLWIGPKLVVVFSDPTYIELLFNNMKHITKASFYRFIEPAFGQGLITSSGETWKKHRKIIAPTLCGQHVTKFVDIYNSNLDILVKKLSQYQDGSSFDILQIMNLFALDVVCEAAMGVKMNTMLDEHSEYCKAINDSEDAIFRRIFQPWLHPEVIFRISPTGRQEVKSVSIVKSMTNRVIQERKKQRLAESAVKRICKDDNDNEEQHMGIKTKMTFLDSLLHQVETGANFTDTELRDEVVTLMAAGHETTAITMSYVCWLLAKHQDVQEKIVDELREIFGSSLRKVCPRDLQELKYLEQVIKETLRLFPIVPVFARRLTEDLITGKYVIPAGSEILVNVYMLHRHPQYFPDPETFDPDRFLPENCASRHPYAYIPFSAGPRNCVGYKFAMHEIKTTLATLLRHFKILPPENSFQNLRLIVHLVLKPKDGIPIRLEQRNF